jgi:hypothetical protein
MHGTYESGEDSVGCHVVWSSRPRPQHKQAPLIFQKDLKIALEAYARQSGVRLVYLSEDVRDRRTSGAR